MRHVFSRFAQLADAPRSRAHGGLQPTSFAADDLSASTRVRRERTSYLLFCAAVAYLVLLPLSPRVAKAAATGSTGSHQAPMTVLTAFNAGR